MSGASMTPEFIARLEACPSPRDALQLARQAQPGQARAAALRELGRLLGRRAMFDSAAAVFAEAAAEDPANAAAWLNLGRALDLAYRPAEAMHALTHAESLLSTNPQRLAEALALQCKSLLKLGHVPEAEARAMQSLAVMPGNDSGREALSACRLAVGDWAAAMQTFDREAHTGENDAMRAALPGVPTWRGHKVRRLVLFGMYGIGDEIVDASMAMDAAQRAEHVVLECDPRLHRLFARSFPDLEVRGTRGQSHKPWARARRFDAMASTTRLATLFRSSAQSYPGTPYLQADPVARQRWRAEFDALPRPVVGIAWSGGTVSTGEATRLIGLAAFGPLILSTCATFVSLQYRDAAAEIEASGLPVRQYPGATLARDYDQTAALVAELDAIVGPPTSVHHLAGALGKASTVLVPSVPGFDHAPGECSQWFPTQRYHRQRDGETWAECMARLDPRAVVGGQS